MPRRWPSASGIDLKVVPIEEAHVAFASMLAPVLGREPFGLTDENLQSRLRGVLLMAVSNAKGWIVLTTGNKSEMATGYSTLYGDSAGGFAVIKDVPKTLVYELCRYRNTQAVLEGLPGPIPDSVLDKPPSAELRPDQRDDQSLPPYEELDPVLAGLRGARPHCGRARRRRASTRRWSTRWSAWSTAPSTSAARTRRACASRPRPSARTAGCRSPTATAPRRSRSRVVAEAPDPGLAGIDELAALVGHYCWLEWRIFEVTGAWAGAGHGGATRGCGVWCAAVARRHGELATRWAERLPVRAGVDAGALVRPAVGRLAEAFERLGWPRRGRSRGGRPGLGGAAPAGRDLRRPSGDRLAGERGPGAGGPGRCARQR